MLTRPIRLSLVGAACALAALGSVGSLWILLLPLAFVLVIVALGDLR